MAGARHDAADCTAELVAARECETEELADDDCSCQDDGSYGCSLPCTDEDAAVRAHEGG